MLTAVAAPNKLPVNAPVLNTLAVPALVVTILGLAPFKLKVVAFVPVIVALPIVNVPVEAPILTAVAAPNKLPVNAPVLNTFAVVTPADVLNVAVPDVLLPLIIKILSFVLAPIVNVVAAVALVPILTVVAYPPTLTEV